MNPSQSKKDEYKKIYTKSKPILLKLAKELYIDDISDNFFLEIGENRDDEIIGRILNEKQEITMIAKYKK